jgi:hypothetical protein
MAKIWKVTWQYVNGGQECDLGLHYQWDGETGSTEISAEKVCDVLDTKLTTAIKNMVRDTGSVVAVIAREEVDPTGTDVPEVHEKPLGVAGTIFSGTAGSLPYELVPLFHRKTSGAVKGGQSWCFGPSPLGGAGITNGLWDTGSVPYGAWSTFAALLDDRVHYDNSPAVTGTVGDLVPVAYTKTRRKRGISPYTFNVTSAGVARQPRWLRSRKQ